MPAELIQKIDETQVVIAKLFVSEYSFRKRINVLMTGSFFQRLSLLSIFTV
jgi:hypothetical protein